MTSLVTVSYSAAGLILEFGKLDFKRHEAGRTKVCAAIDVMPVPRYSSIDGKYPLLLHFASTSHEPNVSYHYIKCSYTLLQNSFEPAREQLVKRLYVVILTICCK